MLTSTSAPTTPTSPTRSSATPVISIPHPGESNHNGMLAFTPDGLLLIGTGDGSGSGDPNENAQDTDSLLGKILRIDVDGSNPYTSPPTTRSPTTRAGRPRCGCGVCATPGGSRWTPPRTGSSSGTSARGDARDRRHLAGGWLGQPRLGHNGGHHLLRPAVGCPRFRADPPHPRLRPRCRSAVTGVRSTGVGPHREKGLYFFGDYVTGRVWTLRYSNGVVSNLTERPKLSVPSLASFGVDAGASST